MTAATYGITTAKSQKMTKTLVIIDFGNGDVKAKFRTNGSDSWDLVKFTSSVATTKNESPDGLRIQNEFYLIGDAAHRVECRRTGSTDSGKIKNALPLLLHAIREGVGFGEPITADVIFTCPSVKQYGEDITKAIQGVHSITIPGDTIAMQKALRQTVTIGKIVPQLEGHRAMELIRDKLKGEQAVLVDIGNRTIIVTIINNQGRILARKPFDACGVNGVVSRVLLDESLAGMDGLKRCPSEADIMEYIFAPSRKKDSALANAIADHLRKCTQDSLAFIDQVAPRSPVYLLGGGASLPGITQVFEGAKVIKNSRWATVDGLCSIADKIMGAA